MIEYKDITIHPFGVIVRVAKGETMREIHSYWQDNWTPKVSFKEEDYAGCDGCVITELDDSGRMCYGLLLERNVPISVIVHEVFHLVMLVAGDKGNTYSEDSSEWYAYTLGNVFDDVYKFMTENE